MTDPLAPRMARFKASESNLAGDRARALRREGHHVVDFSIGEPDFAVPDHVKQAIVAASDRSFEQAKTFAAAATARRPLAIFRELHLARQWLDAQPLPDD